jgi:hypothetical protein
MPFNGSGTFVPLPAPDYPAVTGTTISSTAYNNFTVDVMSNGLSKTLVRDGQAAMTGNLNFGGFRGTNLAAPVASTDAATLGTLGNYLLKVSNLSDLPSVATARTNLGLGTAALNNTSDFKTAGAVESIATGGTGQTTAAAGLAALGGAPLNAPDFTGQVEIQSDTAVGTTPALVVRNIGTNQGLVQLGNNVWFFGGTDFAGWQIQYGASTSSISYSDAVGLRVQKGSTNGGVIRLGDNCDLQGGNDFSGFRMQINTATVMTLDASGNAVFSGNVTANSDRRLKADIEPLTGALEAVTAMRPVRFTRISDGSRQIGLIAQEVEEVRREYVHTDGDGLKSLAYQNIVADLIGAVQVLASRIAALEAAL